MGRHAPSDLLLDLAICQASSLQVSSLQVSSLQVSSLQVVTYPAGGAVTLSCSDETNTTRNLSDITQINWRREDGPRSLYYVSDGTKHDTNFSDPRISLLSAQYPPILQITDARAGDAGNYSCKITMVSSGVIRKSWSLQISDPVRSPLIYIIPSVIGLILIITAGLIYCKFCSKWK
ncbi:hypothetical protein GDO81_025513 [Engystomops pustulosus]|uniref:Ig-like domain-containing protein n=1 Tax=Engystomops pustulosus TaxID=76066 RepID=A0AAV6Z3V6_ENGPU|nr:hypothetical protein GDO81_025513 [Engystomops pustulosus]